MKDNPNHVFRGMKEGFIPRKTSLVFRGMTGDSDWRCFCTGWKRVKKACSYLPQYKKFEKVSFEKWNATSNSIIPFKHYIYCSSSVARQGAKAVKWIRQLDSALCLYWSCVIIGKDCVWYYWNQTQSRTVIASFLQGGQLQQYTGPIKVTR